MRQIFITAILGLSCITGAAQAAPNPLERLVVSTYKEYALVAVFDDPMPGTPLEFERLPKLRRIFADDLARAIVADSACTEKTGGVCSLGETILFGSQDPVALELTVETKGSNSAEVCFKDNEGRKSCLKISGAMEGGRAVIRDIAYPDGDSLREKLHLKR